MRRSGVRDAVLDFVHPQLGAGGVRGAEVVDALAGLQLERDQTTRVKCGPNKTTDVFPVSCS